MKKLEIIGFKRANLGKADSKKLRDEANVPCVLYGGKDQVHFHSPMYLFKDLIYTPEVHTVELTVEGKTYNCVLKDAQFHPVNETILHADFLEIFEDKIVKMEIPIRTHGTSPGVMAGGRLAVKQPRLQVVALPKDLPDFIDIDISGLNLGDSFRVKDVATTGYTLAHPGMLPIISVASTRATRSAATEEAKKK